MTEEKKDRREFLVKMGIGAGVVGIGTQAAASLRSLIPNVSYDAPTTVKIGLPAEFPDGLKFLPEEQKAELRARADANGLPLSAMIKDDDRCIRCGLCAVRCPTDAMTMERFQVVERFAPAPTGIAPTKESV